MIKVAIALYILSGIAYILALLYFFGIEMNKWDNEKTYRIINVSMILLIIANAVLSAHLFIHIRS